MAKKIKERVGDLEKRVEAIEISQFVNESIRDAMIIHTNEMESNNAEQAFENTRGLSVEEIIEGVRITLSPELMELMNEEKLNLQDIGDAMYEYLKTKRSE